jgi:hypothetical protein
MSGLIVVADNPTRERQVSVLEGERPGSEHILLVDLEFVFVLKIFHTARQANFLLRNG